MVRGCGRTAAGIGILPIRGAGRRFITDAGFATEAVAGIGRRIVFGVHRGFAGAILPTTVVGRRCRPERASRQDWVGRIGDNAWALIATSGSLPLTSILFPTETSPTSTSGVIV